MTEQRQRHFKILLFWVVLIGLAMVYSARSGTDTGYSSSGQQRSMQEKDRQLRQWADDEIDHGINHGVPLP